MTQVAAPEPTASNPKHGTTCNIAEVIDNPCYEGAVASVESFGTRRTGAARLSFKPQSMDHPVVGYYALAYYRNASKMALEVDGRERPAREFLPGDLELRPPESRYCARYLSPMDVSIIALEEDLLEEMIGERYAQAPETLRRLGERPFRSNLIASLLHRLDTEIFLGSPAGALYTDSLLQAIAEELWRFGVESEPAQPAEKSDLSQKTLRALNHFIDECSDAKIELASLAGIADMPMLRFSREFKSFTGATPYRYVLDRRIAKARSMIESSSLSLAEIAFRCGFSSQSHMTDVFSAKLGATPGAIRRAII